jgi:putative nucleotidyltransferase with HDIG domain
MDTLRGFVTMRSGDSLRVLAADSVTTFPAFLARARTGQPGMESSVADGLLVKLLTTFFRPTLTADRAGTEARRVQVSDSVPLYKFEVRAQEAIVREYQVVGPAEHERLRALRAELQARQVGQRNFGRLSGAVLFNMLLVGLFGFAIFKFRPPIYASLRSLITMAAAFALVIVAASFVARAPGVRAELVPVAVVAITFTVLFDSRISVIASMMLAVLIGGQEAFAGTNAHFLNMVAGPVAVFSVRLMHQRNQAYYSMLAISSAYALGAIAIGLASDGETLAILESALYGAVNAMITVPFAMLLLPLAEEFTGIDTYPRLLEWSDLNRPLMRQLSLEAPGTYAHTMMIANLAEAGCNAIGANGMLARVGAYYHDIGKLKTPQFFVENQARGRNPHDLIPPDQSAAIIRKHVPEGLQMAAKHKLPRTIAAFISEHHGTGPITYFLDKTTELHGPPENLDDYRYPGPIPQSAETAVVMLADAAEASARVITEPTPQKLREMVGHIIALRMEQGQLADAPLTLREIELIKEEVARVLSGSHHARIDYPVSSGGVSAGFGS